MSELPVNSPPDPVGEPARLDPRNYDELIARVGEQPVPTPQPQPPTTPPLPPPPTVPAGWYPDPDNTDGFRYGGAPSMRYFDGFQWTEHRAPMQRRQQSGAVPPLIVNQQVGPMPIVVKNGSSSLLGLHLVLTLLTCGLWLPFWGIIELIGAMTRK